METVETTKKESPESSVGSIGKQGKIVLDVDPPIYYEDDNDNDECEKHPKVKVSTINKYYTRDTNKILIYGFLRLLLDSNNSDNLNEIIDDNDNICNEIYKFYTKISLLNNCFFVYGTLRDDETEQENTWTQHSDAYLAIVYGFKMYGINGFPAAKMTNNNKDYMIGRIIHFKDDQQFKEKKLWADDIEGFNENKREDQQFYIRKKIVCFIFHQLNDEKLQKMGYYDDDKIIDFSNQPKMKQEAFIYYQKNAEEQAKETPNCDWIKRYL